MQIIKKYAPLLLFLSILFLSVYFRTVNLHADPPTEQFLEAGDEGTHSYAARQLYLKGNWAPDGVYFAGMMPVYPLLQIIGVMILGVHNYAFRSVNVVFSLATALLVFWFLKKELGRLPAYIGFMSLGLSFFFILFSKTGLPEATMVFFSAGVFVSHFYALKYTNHPFLRGSVTGFLVCLAFFTKQSSISVVGLVFISASLLFLRQSIQSRKIWNRYAKYICGIVLSVLVFLSLYVFVCVVPAWEKWIYNTSGTWGGNRPRKALLQPPYLLNQIRFTIANPLWTYLHAVTTGTVVAILLFFQNIWKGKNRTPLLETLAIVWFAILLVYIVIIPLKGARFFVPIIIPMTLLHSSLFSKANLRVLKTYFGRSIVYTLYGIVVLELAANLFFGYWYFVSDPQFQTLDSVKKLSRFVSTKSVGNYPVQWMMNARYNTINSFLVPVTDKDLSVYYQKYGWPQYIVILNRQVQMYKRNAPAFFKTLEFVTAINGYTLYKINHI